MGHATSLFLAAAALILSGGCLTAAYALQTFAGPCALLAWWPDYARAMAEQQPEPWLARWLALAPRDTEARVRSALLAEWRGDLDGADTALAQAARDDQRYRAQWPRLEFELRHPERGAPWTTARRCFMMSYGDRRPLLEALWRARPDGTFLLRNVIPDSPPVLFYATSFFMEQDDLGAARTALARLIALPIASESRANAGLVASATERAHLGLDLADLHLDRGESPQALQLWQSLVRRGLVTTDGAERVGRQVVNPTFRTPPTGRGFDWRPAKGVDGRQGADGWHIDLGPHPAERAVLLQQRVLWPAPVPQIESNAPGYLVATAIPAAGAGMLQVEYRRSPGQKPWRQPIVIRRVAWSTR
ncbi:MAG: hypothetical protein K2X03_06685 [Bryobacteraceae bacterium]|nr:hypothetical protein [Bryobacteraceae bacterium]